MTRPVVVGLLLLTLAAACTSQPHRESTTPPPLVAETLRTSALVAAHVWKTPAVPPAQADFSGNGSYPGAFSMDADVDCAFELRGVSGTTPKFYCRTAAGERLKVKYGEDNPEIPAQFAASRLLDALGFAVDRMNIVGSVRCRGCPAQPFEALQCADAAPARTSQCLTGSAPAKTVTFPHAMIERTFPGREIQASADEGWAFYELDRIDPGHGGAARREVDALRLIAVLLAHWDNKGSNQRLVCAPGHDSDGGSCTAPVAVLHDLGATFGPLKADLPNWQRVPVWADARACRIDMSSLPYKGATFGSAVVTEEGRRLALSLLEPLTTAQLDALFTSSGMTRYDAVTGASRQASAWTSAFRAKVAAIAGAGPCPSAPARP